MNFPWPNLSKDAQRQAIESAAQSVLDARSQIPGASLADLYDPLSMPPALLEAHQKLAAAVDQAYGKSGFKPEASAPPSCSTYTVNTPACCRRTTHPNAASA